MRIRLKVKYRPQQSLIVRSAMTDSAHGTPCASSGRVESQPDWHVAAADDGIAESGPLVHSMSQFFELPQRVSSAVDDPAFGPEDRDRAARLRQIPVEEVSVRPESRIVVHTDPLSAGADRFRLLRMRLRELWTAGKLKSLLITSALPMDGKSTIALNLATVLAERGARTVLLIDADLYRPTLSSQLGLGPRVGLAEALEGRVNPMSAIRRLEPLNWYFLSAGEPRSNPTELLQTETLAGMIRTFSAYFDWILIDSPPVVPLTDALSLARKTSATLLVAREGHTPRKAMEKAITLVGKQRVLGIVFNAADGLEKLYSGYYGYAARKR